MSAQHQHYSFQTRGARSGREGAPGGGGEVTWPQPGCRSFTPARGCRALWSRRSSAGPALPTAAERSYRTSGKAKPTHYIRVPGYWTIKQLLSSSRTGWWFLVGFGSQVPVLLLPSLHKALSCSSRPVAPAKGLGPYWGTAVQLPPPAWL